MIGRPRHRPLLSSALFFFAAVPPVQAAIDGTEPVHSVSGTVTNSITGLPISDATVTILDSPLLPAMTDPNGMYLFPSVPDGTYDIEASRPGLLSQTQVGVVVNDDTVVDFALDSAALCDHVPGNLVANCGFETGDFTSWARSGDLSWTSIECGGDHSGTCELVSGPPNLGFIAQNLATTPGASYSVCYWLANQGGPANEFQVTWDGTVIRDSFDQNPFPYSQTCYDVVAQTDTTEVKFGFRQVSSFFLFDDVSVAPQ